jgi:hypothetical protein
MSLAAFCLVAFTGLAALLALKQSWLTHGLLRAASVGLWFWCVTLMLWVAVGLGGFEIGTPTALVVFSVFAIVVVASSAEFRTQHRRAPAHDSRPLALIEQARPWLRSVLLPLLACVTCLALSAALALMLPGTAGTRSMVSLLVALTFLAVFVAWTSSSERVGRVVATLAVACALSGVVIAVNFFRTTA